MTEQRLRHRRDLGTFLPLHNQAAAREAADRVSAAVRHLGAVRIKKPSPVDSDKHGAGQSVLILHPEHMTALCEFSFPHVIR